jgi:hypothetical protein
VTDDRQTRAQSQKQTRADRMRKYDPTDAATDRGDRTMSEPTNEPGFYDHWYTLGIRSQEATNDGGDIGNRAYMDWMERVILATGRSKVDWTQVSLAVILDREVRADEARRDAERTAENGADL